MKNGRGENGRTSTIIFLLSINITEEKCCGYTYHRLWYLQITNMADLTVTVVEDASTMVIVYVRYDCSPQVTVFIKILSTSGKFPSKLLSQLLTNTNWCVHQLNR
jgi:hypothetical protein